MHNRFNINESEKNRIKGLHGINEQSNPTHDKLMDEITKWCGTNDEKDVYVLAPWKDLFNAMGDYCVENVNL